MMGVIEPEQTPAPISMEQEQALAAESEAAPREEEVIPEGTAEAETGGIVLGEELERQGPALTNETLRDWTKRWCAGDREGLPPISTWNTSQVTDFSKLFMNQEDFNDDISAWNTSNATDMSFMFKKARSFNQPLNDWRVDNVTTMGMMFHQASAFDQPLGAWRVDNVEYMDHMFMGASSFNQPLGKWRVDNVMSMYAMFHSAMSFNQPLGDWRLRAGCKTQSMFAETNFQNSRPVKEPSPCCSIS